MHSWRHATHEDDASIDADIDTEVHAPEYIPINLLYCHTGAAYGLPAETYRNGRLGPPPSDKGLFATLYTGKNIAAAAMESTSAWYG